MAETGLAPPLPSAVSSAGDRAKKRSLLAVTHLIRLSKGFVGQDVDWVALKGPGLSAQIYGDPTVRTIRDLDVIVAKSGLPQAVTVAESLGWKAPVDWMRLNRLADRYDIALEGGLPGQPLLELHGNLGPKYNQFRLDPFSAGTRGMTPITSSVAVPTLRGYYQTTYVAWHGARGLWYRLTWLLDFARLLHTTPDAGQLLAVAQDCGAEIAVRAAAAVTCTVFYLPKPVWPAATPALQTRVDVVARWFFERLALGVDAPTVWTPPGSYRWLWREVAQQERPWAAAIAAVDQITRPTLRDARRLGGHFPIAAHRLARPFFLAERLVQGR